MREGIFDVLKTSEIKKYLEPSFIKEIAENFVSEYCWLGINEGKLTIFTDESPSETIPFLTLEKLFPKDGLNKSEYNKTLILASQMALSFQEEIDNAVFNYIKSLELNLLRQ